MNYSAINFREKLAKFQDQWSPKVIAEMNDYQFKLAKLEGDFVWHSHPETDEVFLVLEGRLRIDFHDGAATLESGEMIVIPRGVAHKPFAAGECQVLLVEPAGTLNTGDAGGERTVSDPSHV
jgi:mannose-6-phosphate isomerase-like protein (cupin superfamily)